MKILTVLLFVLFVAAGYSQEIRVPKKFVVDKNSEAITTLYKVYVDNTTSNAIIFSTNKEFSEESNSTIKPFAKYKTDFASQQVYYLKIKDKVILLDVKELK